MTEVTDEELVLLPVDDSIASRVAIRLRRVEALLNRSQAAVLEQKASVEKVTVELTSLKEKVARKEVELAELQADVAAAERYSRILNNSIETKNSINATLRVELMEANKQHEVAMVACASLESRLKEALKPSESLTTVSV